MRDKQLVRGASHFHRKPKPHPSPLLTKEREQESCFSYGVFAKLRCCVYVTLEPCSFHGRTPACALAIAEDHRIHEIYVSIVDPDPRNNGQGLDILRKAGKTVNVGLCANEVNAFLNQYLIK